VGSPFGGFYAGRPVLVTGHTGFKGSWLATWLDHLGARVTGYALAPPTEPSHFVACRLAERLVHVPGDVRDFEGLLAAFAAHRPEVVFHLAAQSLVRVGFAEPRLTFEVNVMGTVNLLEAARRTASVTAVVAVTSDKCYRNVGWPWGYREADPLGGADPYGASKAGAEIVVEAYGDAGFQRATATGRALAVASARAGNVIGGGDWARDRVVPDAVRAITSGTDLILRQPDAVRPWQHVLESLAGYLTLGAGLAGAPERHRGAWNFGPEESSPLTVSDLAAGILARWPAPTTRVIVEPDPRRGEAGLLRLDPGKARAGLGWRPAWPIGAALDATVAWYRRYYATERPDPHAGSVEQIDAYVRDAAAAGLGWAGGTRP
jgi:CDP-glucose 4,6-dehydratase